MDVDTTIKVIKAVTTVLGAVVTLAATAAELLGDVADAVDACG